MELKKNYFIITFITFLVATVGSYFTAGGMDWYDNLVLPEIAPPGSFIGIVWTIIFILTTVSVILFWNEKRRKNFKIISLLFALNAILNVLWSFVFFTINNFELAIVEMIILNVTNLLLIYFLYGYKKISAYLLIPYFVWVSFATYLAYMIYIFNT